MTTTRAPQAHLEWRRRMKRWWDRAAAGRWPWHPPAERALDDWLRDETGSHAILKGEAGAGRSSLLARWAQGRLDAAPPVRLLAVNRPAGLAFAWQVLPLFADVLDDPLGLEPAPALHASVRIRRALAEGSRPVVIVIDGWDETIGWSLGDELAAWRPKGAVRFVVSADAEHALEVAEVLPGEAIRTIALGPLAVRDVSVILEMRFGADAPSPGLPETLVRLSGGSPLVLDLYLDAMMSVGVARERELEALESAESSLGGFLRWFWETRSIGDRATDLAALLAEALGPVAAADLARASQTPLKAVERELVRLAPLLLRDGNRVSLRHDALRRVITDVIAPSACESAARRWLDDGRAVIAVEPKDGIPPYVVEHRVAHLDRAAASFADYRPILTFGWMQAWQRLDPSTPGLERDADSAFEAAADALADPSSEDLSTRVADLARCAIVRAGAADRRRAVLAPEAPMPAAAPALVQALFSLAMAASEKARIPLLRWAYESCGDAPKDGRMLLAIARMTPHPSRAAIVRDAVSAFRHAEGEGQAGATIWLVCLAPLASGDEAMAWIDEAIESAAAVSRPELLGALARGDDPFESRGAKPLSPDMAEALWERTRAWPPRLRQRLAVRLAAIRPPPRDAAIRAALEGIRAMADDPDAQRDAGIDLAALAPDLARSHLKAARAILDRLDRAAAFVAIEPLALRHLELGAPHGEALELLERLSDPWYPRALANALPWLPEKARPPCVARVRAHLNDLDSERTAWFIEAHAPGLVHATVLVLEVVSNLPPRDRLVASASLVPRLPASSRPEWIGRMTDDLSILDDPPYFALARCAAWLPEDAAVRAWIGLLDAHNARASLLRGDEGDPREYPGIAQLAPLVTRLGGDDALLGVANALVEAAAWLCGANGEE